MIGVNLEQNLLERVLRRLGCFLCRPQLEDDGQTNAGTNDLISTDMDGESTSSTASDDPKPPIYFPVDEILYMTRRKRQQQQQQQQQQEGNIHQTFGVIEGPPLAGGIVKRVELMGIFPTCRWMGDVTMPPDVKELFGGSPFFPLGEYRVANIDIVDASKTLHSLTLIVNKGVEGLLTGYWGAAFATNPPHACWARFETTDSHESTVREEALPLSDSSSGIFQEFDCLEFCDDSFSAGFAPGTCTTQIEKILGLTAQFLLEIEWKDWLPDSMLEVRDTSCKLERKRRARLARRRLAELTESEVLD
jgi:hypothetical protein